MVLHYTSVPTLMLLPINYKFKFVSPTVPDSIKNIYCKGLQKTKGKKFGKSQEFLFFCSRRHHNTVVEKYDTLRLDQKEILFLGLGFLVGQRCPPETQKLISY